MGRRSGKKRYKKKTYSFVKDIVAHLEVVVGDNREIVLPEGDAEDESDNDSSGSDSDTE